ncbi:MAG: phospholipid-binding protein MlaC [Succinivibrio sp.]
MKKLLSYFVTAVFLCICEAEVFAADQVNPYELANRVATETVAQIQANKSRIAEDGVAQDIIEKNLMPYIDVKYAAYKVIGTSLNKTTAQDRERFTDEFANYMKRSLVDVLSKYTNQTIVPAKVEAVDDAAKLISVKMLIKEEGKKDLELILKLRKNAKTGEWKAFDLIGENISMLDAKVSELSPIIKSKGIDAAIEVLNTKEQK